MQITDLQIIKATMSNMEALVALFLSYLDFYKRQARTAEAEAFLRSRFEADESVVFLAARGLLLVSSQPSVNNNDGQKFSLSTLLRRGGEG
jgi:hypothetical protein